MKHLVIAAHPDDEILGCGGLIAKYSVRNDFWVLILTDGSEKRYDKSMKDVLKKNSLKANSIVGTKQVYFENFPNQGLETVSLLSLTMCIEKYIDQLKPEIIFTHSAYDLNLDHRIVFDATLTASRSMPGQIVKKLYSYFVASSSEWNRPKGNQFSPNIFIDISESIDKKIQAIESYESEIRPYPHPRHPKSISTYAAFWGISVGLHYAEPFQLIQNISGEL